MKTLLQCLLMTILALVFACTSSTSDPKDTTQKDTDTGSQDAKVPEYERSQGVDLMEFDGSQLPEKAEYTGEIVMGERWKDKLGENFLILTETETKTTETSNGDQSSADLYGYHYVVNDSGLQLLWDIYDFVKECEFDISLNHIQRSLTITDLDKDGIAESTFLYRLACRSDVSPANQKLMMHENGQKFALRGFTRMPGWGEAVGEDSDGGNFKTDATFDSAPEAFLTYAKAQWDEFEEEFGGM